MFELPDNFVSAASPNGTLSPFARSRAKDEEAGEIPVAFIVRKEGSSVSEEALMDYVAKQVIVLAASRLAQIILHLLLSSQLSIVYCRLHLIRKWERSTFARLYRDHQPEKFFGGSSRTCSFPGFRVYEHEAVFGWGCERIWLKMKKAFYCSADWTSWLNFHLSL